VGVGVQSSRFRRVVCRVQGSGFRVSGFSQDDSCEILVCTRPRPWRSRNRAGSRCSRCARYVRRPALTCRVAG
jgi:hypothetical protein